MSEVGVLDGKGYVREPENEALTRELNQVLQFHQSNLLIGIPTMDPKGSRYGDGKTWGWARHKERYAKLWPPGREYYSALISRPDCGDWMLTHDYAKAVQKLWLGKTVTLIGSEPDRNKMRKAIELTQEVNFIECPFKGAYSVIDELEEKALQANNDITILCHGVSATCLAARLNRKGLQAIDLGSIGGFLHKMLTDSSYENEIQGKLENTAKL